MRMSIYQANRVRGLHSWSLAAVMKLLFFLVVALVSSAIADIVADVKEWTEEEVAALLNTTSSDAIATVPELIAKNGYTVEIHHVTTEDGYILQMHRIPATPTSPASDDKPVVFLMHGTICSSAVWVVTGPENGFAYILADAGYDVWMGNARGNTYSKNHTTLTDLDGPEFWYFDWHEIGYYDQPAMIDYALETTGQEKIIFIGHSQGTTTFYVMASLRPEYNDKIRVMFSLAPIVYMSNMRSPVFRLIGTFEYGLSFLFDLIGAYEFLPSSDLIHLAEATFCGDDALTQALCSYTQFLLFGFDVSNLNTTMLPTIIGHGTAGSSTRQVIHYAQEVQTGKFQYYNQDWMSNLENYGSIEAPEYDLSAVTAPVHVIYSDNDWMSAVKDAAQHYAELGNPIEFYRVPDDNWNHIDFLWGIKAKDLVYDHVICTIKANYSN